MLREARGEILDSRFEIRDSRCCEMRDARCCEILDSRFEGPARVAVLDSQGSWVRDRQQDARELGSRALVFVVMRER
jgi:hypothetical protein